MLLTMCSDCVINSTSFGWGKGGNVTSVGWQITLCDPVWYVSSRSGVSSIARGVARRLIKSTCSIGQIHGALSCCSKVHCRLRMWHCQNLAIYFDLLRTCSGPVDLLMPVTSFGTFRCCGFVAERLQVEILRRVADLLRSNRERTLCRKLS